MELWIIFEIITGILLALTCLLVALIMHIHPKTNNIPSIIFAISLFYSYFLFEITNVMSILFKNEFLARLSGVLLYLFLFILVISVNYFTKESFLSIGFCFICSLGLLVIYVSTQSDVVQLITNMGYSRLEWRGLFYILGILCNFLAIFYLFYWGLKTYINAPFVIKKKASLFFIGIIFDTVITSIFYCLFIINPIFISFVNISLIIGSILIINCIIQEPKLLYILPISLYRISVRNHNGYPLYDHDWSESNINELMFTGFLNAIEIMSEEVMNIGGILDINLNKGVLIVNRSKYITVGLIASKESKLLKDCVYNFTIDFEEKFERILRKSCIVIDEYKSAYELIDKYFSNFSTRFIKDKKSPIYLPNVLMEPLKAIDNELNIIFQNDEEYKEILNDLINAPVDFTSNFFKLYKELKDETEDIDYNDNKKLGIDYLNFKNE